MERGPQQMLFHKSKSHAVRVQAVHLANFAAISQTTTESTCRSPEDLLVTTSMASTRWTVVLQEELLD